MSRLSDKVDDNSNAVEAAVELGAQQNIVKILFGLVQLVAGGITLYRSRADQLDHYGYGAFGLSVIPYVFMSAINTFASLARPDYPSLYLVHTPCMDKARGEGAMFESIVGSVVRPEALSQRVAGSWPRNFTGFAGWLLNLSIFTLLVTPFAITAGLSGLRPGDSTSYQRGWLMAWLIMGSISTFVVWVINGTCP